jgi:tetratricopeptide (TPR) repeat protein
MRHHQRGLIQGFALAACLLASGLSGTEGVAQTPPQGSEDREKQVMERFLTILERAPRRGTALDRIYGYHVERGTLDTLIKSYQDRTAKDPNDGTGWLILGLLESHRGRDALAVAALTKAEEERATDPMPAYYLGQALVLVGQPDRAAEAFERALTRSPNRADTLEIFQSLGRVHQRARRNDQALTVWGRLEKLYPNDVRVQEQIATALAEESQLEPALTRYEALAKSTRDPYRLVQFRTEAADLKVKLNRKADALRDFESLLEGLNPDSWLHREVRRKIEDVFLRNDDQAGLTTYYEAWVKNHPDDVEAMARLGRTLAGQSRPADARKWFDQALKLAPSRSELRRALIEQFVEERKYAEAAAQYEAMAKTDPNNPDVVRDWGRTLLKDTTRPEAERKKAAATVWRRLTDTRPNDAATSAQVADLFRQAEFTDEAIALYRKAVDLAPDSPQYREYLGEYYHTLKRNDEAKAVWNAMAAGKNRNAKSLTRLGEVLGGFGYKTEAIEAIAEARKLDPDSFDLRVKYAELLVEAQRFQEADAELSGTEKLADNDDQRETLLGRRIACDQAANRLGAIIETLKADVAGAKVNDASTWRRLARYEEAAQRGAEAIKSAEKAVALDPKSVDALLVAARLYESSGRFGDAAESFRKLAILDRRARTEHLTNVAKLEARLGRREAALKAGRDLLAAAPGNPDHFQFFSDLCFQLGENEEGLETLRKAARANESDTKSVLNLAEALAREFRTEEAIELFWRAFDRSPDLDGKLGIVSRLADLYLQRDQFDRLIARLERLQREESRQREAALCLAQAHASSGDFGSARQQLENLLVANPRDTALLKQLSALAENEGDIMAASKYQKQLFDVSPSDEATNRLAQLYVRSGEINEAEALWAHYADGHDLSRVLQAADSLYSSGKYDAVLATTERLLRNDPTNWEALVREGRALFALERHAEASKRFQAILAIRRSDDDQSEITKAMMKGGGGSTSTVRAVGTTAANSPVTTIVNHPVRQRISAGLQVRYWLGLDYRASSLATRAWSPSDFGQARAAALGGLFAQAQREKKEDAFLEDVRKLAEKTPTDPRPIWDWLYLNSVRQDYQQLYQVSRTLARVSPRDPSALWMFLTTLPYRMSSLGQRVLINRAGVDQVDTTPPLSPDDLELVSSSYRTLLQVKPEWMLLTFLTSVTAELKRAHREAEVDALYRELVAKTSDLASVLNACRIAGERGDLDTLMTLFNAYERLPNPSVGGMTSASAQLNGMVLTNQGYVSAPFLAMAQTMAARADAKAHADVLKLLDRYLNYVRSPAQVASRARASGSSTASQLANLGTINYTIYLTKTPTSIRLDFPGNSAYLDIGAITLLRNAYELYKRDDLLSDLITHVRKPIDAKGSESDVLYARLALSALRWWSDEKDEAVAELEKASELVPSDAELKLSLADLRAKRQEPDEALAIVDSIESIDQRVTQRRELLALRLAVQSGDVDRARVAAERLFGLRLESEVQVQLASQMHQLGMYELAEAVLARTRRRAGNNTSVLASLMDQYLRQGKPDVAAQVAHQILRRGMSTTTQSARMISVNGEIVDAYQQQAIQTLARSGKLQEMIDRLKAQVARSPDSLQLHQSLATYYQAANKREELKTEYEAIAKLRPDDARLRLQVAAQFAQAGDTAAAMTHYKAAFKKDPSLLGSQFMVVQSLFQRANKLDELMKFLDDVDSKAFANPSFVLNLTQSLLRTPKTVDQGMSVLRRAWKELDPQNRQLLLMRVTDDELWARPEMYAYARDMLIPDPKQIQVSSWFGLDQISSWRSDGRISTAAGHLLELSARQNHLDDLAAEIQQAAQRLPGWLAGKALLAVIRIKQGRIEEGKKTLEGLLTDKASRPPYEARLILGQELEATEAVQTIALALYEGAINDQTAMSNSGLGFQNGPIRQIVSLYRRAGRLPDARAVLLKAASTENERYNYDPQYAAYMRLNDLSGIASLLLEIGYPADAVRYYGDILATSNVVEVSQMYAGDPEYYLRQARTGMEKALHGLDKATLAPALRSLLRSTTGPKPKHEPLDLGLTVYPRELDKAALNSFFITALDLATKDSALLAELEAGLESTVKEHPDDIGAAIAGTLASLSGNTPTMTERVTRLQRTIEQMPLEPLPEGTRANARQRAEAMRRLGLWLVARACWKQKDAVIRETGDRFAALALEAAKRQTDTIWRMAMLREWGQSALDHGDRKLAEARWGSILELIVTPPASSRSPSRKTSAPDVEARKTPVRKTSLIQEAPAPAPPTTKKASPRSSASATPNAQGGSTRNGVPVITVEKFGQASQLAQLAASNGMLELSLRAIRESLAGGPPVTPLAMTDSPRSALVRARTITSTEQAIAQVETSLATLDTLWAKNKLAPEVVYEALRNVVLPASRPGEVFLYPATLFGNPNMIMGRGQSTLPRPRSVGARLVHWAVAAGKTDDLRSRLEQRRSQPMAELSSLVLLSLLAQAESKPESVPKTLEALGARLQKDTLQSSAQLACHAALPALNSSKPPTARAAAGVLERVTKAYESTQTEEPYGTLVLMLARFELTHDNLPEARKKFETYLARSDRNASRYSGDYGIYQRKAAILTVASEYLKAGHWPDVLTLLGQFADAPAYSSGDPSVSTALAAVSERLATHPAAERYETWLAWTLPSASRKSVRALTAFVSPGAWIQIPGGPPKPLEFEDGIVDTATLLIDAARQAGKLDELSSKLQPLAEGAIENARALFVLIEIARGKAATVEPIVKQVLAEREKKAPASRSDIPARGSPMTDSSAWSDLLVARACLADKVLETLGTSLADTLIVQSSEASSDGLQTLMRRIRATAKARRLRREAPRPHSDLDPGLSLWEATFPADFAAFTIRGDDASWVEYDGHVHRIGGIRNDYLRFVYPLSGSFTFSVDAYLAESTGASLGYAGIVFDPYLARSPGQVGNPIGQVRSLGQTLQRPSPFVRLNDFNRLTVQSEAGRVRFLVNGHLFYETDKFGPSNPWLALGSERSARSIFKNPTLTGRPTIPRQVALTESDGLEGWFCTFYNESSALSQRLHADQPDTKALNSVANMPFRAASGRVDDWLTREGEIAGRRIDSPATEGTAPSRLVYQRPLRDGERLSYEFFYEPGVILVHPALGRIAFLLEPEGVRLHVLARDEDHFRFGIKPDNIIDEPDHRRGPKSLPLKPGAWNTIALSLGGLNLTLSLNGTEIYEHPVELAADRFFGLYHDKHQTEARVRNVVLKGDWHESLTSEQISQLFQRNEPASSSDRLASHSLIGEAILGEEAREVLVRTGSQAPVERFEALRKWAAPNSEHGVRTQGYFNGNGKIEAPVLTLVTLGKELSKLDELAKLIDQSEPEPAQLALRTLIQIARQDDNGASASLKALLARVDSKAPDGTPWPELIAAVSALERPALVEPATALLERLSGQPAGTVWEAQIRHNLARARHVGHTPEPSGWTPVSLARSSEQALGFPPAVWTGNDTELSYAPGCTLEALYAKVPIRGDFELSGELSAEKQGQSLRIAYGGAWVGITSDPKHLELGRVGRPALSVVVDPPLENIRGWVPFRMVVKGGTSTAFLGNRKIHEATLADAPDPWLAIVGTKASSGAVRNLTLSGSPVVPETLELSRASDLAGWFGTFDNDSLGGTRPTWEKRGDEIRGRAYEPDLANNREEVIRTSTFTTGFSNTPMIGIPGSLQESLLTYHRPISEDGEIALEFFYDPGKAMVHPALGRVVFLLEPDGVRIHTLTDGRSDKPGLDPGNATTERSNRHGPNHLPLKPHEWNRLVVNLSGDVATVKLNDLVIFERKLESTNSRMFGLFHYADQTEIRVRGMVYRGQWPKIPPTGKLRWGLP